eukprot:7505765-Pyramimonas_sp.AAC.1
MVSGPGSEERVRRFSAFFPASGCSAYVPLSLPLMQDRAHQEWVNKEEKAWKDTAPQRRSRPDKASGRE